MMVRLAAAAILAATVSGATAAEIASLELDLRLDPDARTLVATARARVEGDGEAALTLAPAVRLLSVRVDDRPVALVRRRALVLPLGEGTAHAVEIAYRAELAPFPGEDRRGAPVLAAGPEGAYLPADGGWYPRLAGEARAFRLAITVPAPHRAVATGRLVSEETGTDGYRAVFASEAPGAGIMVAAGPYRIEERAHDGLRLRTYFHPELAHLAGDYLDSVAHHLDLYRRDIGDYPFAGFAVVSAPLPVGLGYPGLTYIGRRVLALPFLRSTSLRHEVLHNWWGNGVRVDYAGGNWAEGLTTFMADYGVAEEEGPEKARAMRLGWLRDFAALPAARDMPLSAFVAKTHDAAQVVGYNKAAFVFHMLRDEIGAPAFAEGLRRFWSERRFGVAAWIDLGGAFAAASGRSLTAFFQQWLDRPGAPRLTLDAAAAFADATGPGVRFALSQEAPAYVLRVPVAVTTEQGIERHAVALARPSQAFEIRTRAAAATLAVDPDFDLWRRLDAAETPPILRDITLGPEAAVVVPEADAGVAAIARRLAEGLFDAPPRFVSADPASLPPGPFLILGLAPAIERFLAAAGLAGAPDAVRGRGTARVWTAREQGRTVLIVVADDPMALDSLVRPLPHYGRNSYLVFEGARMTSGGTWTGSDSPLRARLR